SRLANSTHSCANEGAELDSTKAAEMSGIGRIRMSFPPTLTAFVDRRPRALVAPDRVQFLKSTVVFNVLLSIPPESLTRTWRSHLPVAGVPPAVGGRGLGTMAWTTPLPLSRALTLPLITPTRGSPSQPIMNQTYGESPRSADRSTAANWASSVG